MPAYSGPADRFTESFTYDELGRHTGTAYGDGTGGAKFESFSYDPAGNRTEKVTGDTVFAAGDALPVEAGTELKFYVRRSGDLTGTDTIDVAAVPVRDAQPTDFTQPTPTTLSFGPDVHTVEVSVPTTASPSASGTKEIGLKISAPSAGTGIARDLASGLIVNDMPVFSVEADASNFTEGSDTHATFTITREGPSQIDHVVSFSANSLTASEGADFEDIGTAQITFLAGTATATQQVQVALYNDDFVETGEGFDLDLVGVTNGGLLDEENASAHVDIISEDEAGEFSVTDVTVVEGFPTSLREAKVKITRTGGGSASHEIHYSTVDGTATFADNDYIDDQNHPVTIPAGPLGQEFELTLEVSGDANQFEETESFTVQITGDGFASFPDDTAEVFITDDETGFAIGDATVLEGTAATPGVLKIPFTRVAGNTGIAILTLSGVGGTATSPADYDAITPTQYYYIDPGPIGQVYEINVPIINGDAVAEGDETILISPVFEVGGAIHPSNDGVSEVTILDDDASGQFTIGDAFVTEGDTGTVLVQVPVTRVGGGRRAASFTPTAGGITPIATAGTDFTAPTGTKSIPIGSVGQVYLLPIAIIGDTRTEKNEKFRVVGGTMSGGTWVDSLGDVTINDNDFLEYHVGDATILEGTGAGTTTLQIPITRTAGVTTAHAITYADVAGTATITTDFTAFGGTLTIPAGPIGQVVNVNVTVAREDLAEEDEIFQLQITDSQGAVFQAGSDAFGQGTIQNDDLPGIFELQDATVLEPSTSTTTVQVKAKRVGGGTSSHKFTRYTVNGSATAPADYTALTSGVQTIVSGAIGQTVTFTVSGIASDVGVEGNENLFVEFDLGNAELADGEDNRAEITIVDGDSPGEFSIGDAVAVENNSGTGFTLNVPVTRTGGGGKVHNMTYSTVTTGGATATSGVDFTAKTNTTLGIVSALPGQVVNMTVVIKGDVLAEPSEFFFMNVSNLNGASLAPGTDASALVTIHDNDVATAGVFSIGDATITEGDTGTLTVNLPITRTAGNDAHTLTYSTADGTATAGSDYTAVTNGTISIPAAAPSTVTNVQFTINGDVILESNETFTVTFTDLGGSTLSGDNVGQVTITDNDTNAPGTFTFDDFVVTEGDSGTSVAYVPLVRTAGGAEHTITYRTTGGTASTTTDYVPITTPVSVTIPSSGAPQTVYLPVQIVGDTTIEAGAGKYFNVQIVNADSAILQPNNTARVTINDNDAGAPSVFTIEDISVAEGNSGTATHNVTVKRTAGGAGHTLTYSTVVGNALAVSDFIAVTGGTVSIPSGAVNDVYNIPVSIVGDTVEEDLEAFNVQVTNWGGASATAGTDAFGQVTINDNDGPSEFIISDYTVTENNEGGSVTATITVTRKAGGQAHTLSYKTVDGTALASWVYEGTPGSDYTAIPTGSFTFPAGAIDATMTVNVTVKGDNYEEGQEYFWLEFTDFGGGSLYQPGTGAENDIYGYIYINDNDPKATFTIGNATITEGDAGTSVVSVPVTRTNDSREPVGFNWHTVDGTATAGSDYTEVTSGFVYFPIGTTNQVQNLQVTILNDTVNEPNETFEIVIDYGTEGVPTSGQDNRATITITNED